MEGQIRVMLGEGHPISILSLFCLFEERHILGGGSKSKLEYFSQVSSEPKVSFEVPVYSGLPLGKDVSTVDSASVAFEVLKQARDLRFVKTGHFIYRPVDSLRFKGDGEDYAIVLDGRMIMHIKEEPSRTIYAPVIFDGGSLEERTEFFSHRPSLDSEEKSVLLSAKVNDSKSPFAFMFEKARELYKKQGGKEEIIGLK